MDDQIRRRLVARSTPLAQDGPVTTVWAELQIIELGSIAIARHLLAVLKDKTAPADKHYLYK